MWSDVMLFEYSGHKLFACITTKHAQKLNLFETRKVDHETTEQKLDL